VTGWLVAGVDDDWDGFGGLGGSVLGLGDIRWACVVCA